MENTYNTTCRIIGNYILLLFIDNIDNKISLYFKNRTQLLIYKIIKRIIKSNI